MASVEIPGNIAYIDDYAFSGCSNLTSVEISNGVMRIGEYAFIECIGLKNLKISESVTNIGHGAFKDCKGLESIYLPQGVRRIGKYAFDCGSNLTICCYASEKPEGWEEYWTYTQNIFYNCLDVGTTDSGIKWVLTNQEEVRILEYVGESNQVEIPASINGYNVTVIGKRAFYNLKDLLNIYIPSEVRVIETAAISGCDKLTIYCQSSEQPDEWERDWSFRPIVWNSGKEYGVTDDGYQWHLSAEDTIMLTGYVGSDTQIELPSEINGKSVTHIIKNAFYYCELYSVKIPKSVTDIEQYVFSEIYAMTIYCEAQSQPSGYKQGWNSSRPVVWNCKESGITDDGIKWSLTGDGFMVIMGYVGSELYLELPSEINGYAVTDIGENVFRNYDNLISMVIPSSIIRIPAWAIYDCDCLTIYCEAKSKPEGFENYWCGYSPVVWDCKNNEIADDGYIYIVADDGMRYALKNSQATVAAQLRTISGEIMIPEYVEYKGASYKVTEIGSRAFDNCSKLTGVSIPKSVTGIKSSAFNSCYGLMSLEIPDGVINIGSMAFSGCYIKTIVIPKSVTSMGFYVFDSSNSMLEVIYCEAESQPDGWGRNWNVSGRPVVWYYKAE